MLWTPNHHSSRDIQSGLVASGSCYMGDLRGRRGRGREGGGEREGEKRGSPVWETSLHNAYSQECPSIIS